MIEQGLRRAIERNQLEVHYQPVVALSDQRVIGCEALLRWRHPEHWTDRAGPVSSRLVEESGVIEAIGRWVLRTACLQGRAGWRKDIRRAGCQ